MPIEATQNLITMYPVTKKHKHRWNYYRCFPVCDLWNKVIFDKGFLKECKCGAIKINGQVFVPERGRK